MSQVRVPPEAAHFTLKMTVLGELHLYCVVLLCESLGLNISCILGIYRYMYCTSFPDILSS